MIRVYGAGRTRWVRPLWMLAELGVEHERVVVDPTRGEARAPAFLALNPMGKVPVLEVDGRMLRESSAMVLYLADRFADRDLIAEPGTLARAEHDQWVMTAATELETPLWQLRLHRVILPAGIAVPAVAPAMERSFARAAAVFEAQLATNEWLLGDRFQAVDVVVGYLLPWAHAYGLLAPFPGLVAYMERLMARPAFPLDLYR